MKTEVSLLSSHENRLENDLPTQSRSLLYFIFSVLNMAEKKKKKRPRLHLMYSYYSSVCTSCTPSRETKGLGWTTRGPLPLVIGLIGSSGPVLCLEQQ